MKKQFLKLLLLISLLFLQQIIIAQTNIFKHDINKEYLGFKINYGLRPLNRDNSIIDIGIDSAANEFGTYVYDQYSLKGINNMKGISFGLEYGYNNIFVEGQIDYAIRNKTYLIGPNVYVGYNFTFMHKHPVAFRPAIGVNYNWLWTDLGTYQSNDSDHKEIYITQSNTLLGIKPRMQIEIPVYKIKEEGVVFIRVEAGYQFSQYTSRFIKLKAERTYENSNGKTKTDVDRFYLDGENSGYLINGKHINKPPTSLFGFYYAIEIGVKILNF